MSGQGKVLKDGVAKGHLAFLLAAACSAAPATPATKLEAQTLGIQTLAPIPLRVPVGKSIPCEVFAPVYQGKTLVIPEGSRCTLRAIPTPPLYSDPRYAGTVELDSLTIGGEDTKRNLKHAKDSSAAMKC